jgi:hypothetical protein
MKTLIIKEIRVIEKKLENLKNKFSNQTNFGQKIKSCLIIILSIKKAIERTFETPENHIEAIQEIFKIIEMIEKGFLSEDIDKLKNNELIEEFSDNGFLSFSDSVEEIKRMVSEIDLDFIKSNNKEKIKEEEENNKIKKIEEENNKIKKIEEENKIKIIKKLEEEENILIKNIKKILKIYKKIIILNNIEEYFEILNIEKIFKNEKIINFLYKIEEEFNIYEIENKEIKNFIFIEKNVKKIIKYFNELNFSSNLLLNKYLKNIFDLDDEQINFSK